MSSLDDYEREYRDHVQAAEEKVAVAASSSSSEERRQAVSAAERACEAAQGVTRMMDQEAKTLSGGGRAKVQTQLRGWRDELSALKARIKEARNVKPSPQTADCLREELCAGGDRYRDDTNERSRMLANNDRVSQQTERIKGAHAITMDMESTANSILGDLASQRETLMHAKHTLSMASRGLDSSKRILSQMARRASMNKFTLWVVIGILGTMLLFVFWAGGSSPAEANAAEGGSNWKRADQH